MSLFMFSRIKNNNIYRSICMLHTLSQNIKSFFFLIKLRKTTLVKKKLFSLTPLSFLTLLHACFLSFMKNFWYAHVNVRESYFVYEREILCFLIKYQSIEFHRKIPQNALESISRLISVPLNPGGTPLI